MIKEIGGMDSCKKIRKTGKSFTCKCGKKYLSYPALYTHIKKKHEGKL